MSSTAGDFRHLTPLVLMSALARAGTQVCEPVQRFRLEAPADTLGSLLPVLAGLRATPQTTGTRGAGALATGARGAACLLEGEIPAARVHELQQQLPGLTRGEGALECAFGSYQPVTGPVPCRSRCDHNPVNRKEYLLNVMRGVVRR
jgi:ribosomal protection tetracycline resistance protein